MTTSPLPPPGWHPDPSGARLLRWWDGSAWTTHTAPFAAAARPPLGRGWPVLARWTQVVLLGSALLGVVTACSMWWARAKAAGFRDRPQDYDVTTARHMDDWDQFVSLANMALIVITAVLFICWLYQAARSDRVTLGSWGAGWAIGGWFTPFLSLFVPVLVTHDVNRSANAHAGHDRSRSAAVITGWWVFWLSTNVLAGASVVTEGAHPTFGTLVGYYGLSAAEGATSLVAAVLAIVVVGRITGALAADAGHSRPS